MVHVLNGELLKYRDLLKRLEIDNPVYGLQAVGLDGRVAPHSTVEDMAKAYVDELRTVQPEGPYMLGGLCFAGVLAYEISRQLTDLGEETALLMLIESGPLAARPVRGTMPRLELEREKFRRLLRSDRRGKSEWIALRAKGLKDKIELKTGRLVYDYCLRKGRPLPRRPWNMVFVANVIAIEQAITRPSDAHVTLIRAQGDAERRGTSWSSLARGGVTIRPIIARGINHNNIANEPYVDLLAAEVSDLVRAETAALAARTGLLSVS
jgi:thioesterase domain-containing protein